MQPLGNCFEPSMSFQPRRKQQQRKERTITRIVMAVIGMGTAYWIAATWLPRVELHMFEGSQRWVFNVDWSRTMLGGER